MNRTQYLSFGEGSADLCLGVPEFSVPFEAAAAGASRRDSTHARVEVSKPKVADVVKQIRATTLPKGGLAEEASSFGIAESKRPAFSRASGPEINWKII